MGTYQVNCGSENDTFISFFFFFFYIFTGFSLSDSNQFISMWRRGGVRIFCLALLLQVHTESIQKCARREAALPLISLRTSGNYTFSAVGCRAEASQIPDCFHLPLLPGNADVGCV